MKIFQPLAVAPPCEGLEVADTVSHADLYRAAWASSLGSALEYYDFALYNLASAVVFGPLFFPAFDPSVALLASFSTFFLGFAVRPIGAILFGVLGDRLGRKFVLVVTVLTMGLASTLIGFLPTYATAGFWAPLLLIGLRLVQGLGAGAEQAGAAVLMAEYAPPARRGYFAALPFMGVMAGSLVAATVYLLLISGKGDLTASNVWRIPFLFSAAIIVVAIWVRLRLKESPEFSKLKAHDAIDRTPLANLLKRSRRPLFTVIGLRAAEGGGSAIYQTLALSYITSVSGLGSWAATLSLLLGSLSGVVVIGIAGLLSDRFGRLVMYRIYAAVAALQAFPVWWLLSRGHPASSVIAIVLGLLPVWGMFGTQGALLPELFGSPHRYVGVALGREIASVVFGGTAPMLGAAMIAYVVHVGGNAVTAWIPFAAYMALLSGVSLVTALATPDTRGRDLGAIEDAL